MTVHDFYLSEWIREATQDLCDDARDRVTQEIQSHYADRFAAELAQGRAEDGAHAFAMASLGSAKAARKAYDRTYWTKGDRGYFENIAASRPGGKLSASLVQILLALVCFSAAAINYPQFRSHHTSPLVLGLCALWLVSVLCVVATGLYGTWHAPACYRKGRLRAAVAWHCISNVVPQVVLATMFITEDVILMPSDWSTRALVLVGGAAMVVFMSLLSVWEYRAVSRKLNHAALTADETMRALS
jgi:hypothetical protein